MRHLSGKEKKELSLKLPYGYECSKKDEIVQDGSILLKNKEKFIIQLDNTFIPHLKSLNNDILKQYPKAFIDRGAIPFLLKGADIMRPGISSFQGEFSKDELIIICDEEHHKPLGIGTSLFDKQEMETMEKGKSIQVLHYVNDQFY
jgi:PUA domain protein